MHTEVAPSQGRSSPEKSSALATTAIASSVGLAAFWLGVGAGRHPEARNFDEVSIQTKAWKMPPLSQDVFDRKSDTLRRSLSHFESTVYAYLSASQQRGADAPEPIVEALSAASKGLSSNVKLLLDTGQLPQEQASEWQQFADSIERDALDLIAIDRNPQRLAAHGVIFESQAVAKQRALQIIDAKLARVVCMLNEEIALSTDPYER